MEGELIPGEDTYLQRMRDLLHMLPREWEPDVLVALSSGPRQYTNLLSAIRARTIRDGWSGKNRRDIADSMLNRTLRQMEQDELIERERDETVFPPVASYRLTPAAESLLKALIPPSRGSTNTPTSSRASNKGGRPDGPVRCPSTSLARTLWTENPSKVHVVLAGCVR